jgi:hypothetical protein
MGRPYHGCRRSPGAVHLLSCEHVSHLIGAYRERANVPSAPYEVVVPMGSAIGSCAGVTVAARRAEPLGSCCATPGAGVGAEGRWGQMRCAVPPGR